MKFWEKFKLEDHCYYKCRVGTLVLWMIKNDNELLISEQRLNSEEELGENWESKVVLPEKTDKPEVTNWKRWMINKNENSFRFIPVTPDRPVVVRPENQVQITPEQQTCFYVSIPLFIKIVAGEKNELAIIPTQILSKTWFGEPISGELCYAVKSSAVTSLERKIVKSYTAICPICIENQSMKIFNFARLSIHTEYLSVFAGKKHLWTNQIGVKLEGEDQKSIMDISGSAPAIETNTTKLSVSRETPSKKFYKKMFSDLSIIKG